MTPLRRLNCAMAVRVTWTGAAAALIAACGGSPSNGAMRDEAVQGDVQLAAGEGRGKSAIALASPGDRQVGLSAGGSEATPQGQRYDLIILNERVVHQDLDQLDPRQGKGYQPLRAFIYAKGMPRSSSPVASVKPVCMPTRCEYLPPRKAGLAEHYVVSIPDDSVAQLSADEDVIVVSTRHLGLVKTATVDLTLTIPGQRTIVKRIVYGAVPG